MAQNKNKKQDIMDGYHIFTLDIEFKLLEYVAHSLNIVYLSDNTYFEFQRFI